MAYRRKQSMSRSSTFEDHSSPVPAADDDQPPSLAAQAIRASSAHRDSSLSSAYGESAFSSSAYLESNRRRPLRSPQDSTAYEYTSMKSLDDSKHGFWGVLARKAKSILEDDNVARKFDEHGRHPPQMIDTTTGGQFNQPHWSPENNRRTDNPTIHKGSEAIASSLNYIGGTIKNALEEGLTIVENRTADIIQETRKLQIRRKSGGSGGQGQATDLSGAPNLSQSHNDQETQLKASRDVANAMAAKAKLLLRELKTVKADLAFAKERCTQLEEENKNLRENRQKGAHPEDDDLIRLQLETLLAEKGRLAHENSVYARENRFLREIVEYHQLTMQDVVYLDESAEEVTEVATPLIQFSIQSPPHHHRHPSSEPPSPHLTSTPSTPTSAKSSSPPSPLLPVDPNSTPSQSPTVSAEGVMRHQERVSAEGVMRHQECPSTPR